MFGNIKGRILKENKGEIKSFKNNADRNRKRAKENRGEIKILLKNAENPVGCCKGVAR